MPPCDVSARRNGKVESLGFYETWSGCYQRMARIRLGSPRQKGFHSPHRIYPMIQHVYLELSPNSLLLNLCMYSCHMNNCIVALSFKIKLVA